MHGDTFSDQHVILHRGSLTIGFLQGGCCLSASYISCNCLVLLLGKAVYFLALSDQKFLFSIVLASNSLLIFDNILRRLHANTILLDKGRYDYYFWIASSNIGHLIRLNQKLPIAVTQH